MERGLIDRIESLAVKKDVQSLRFEFQSADKEDINSLVSENPMIFDAAFNLLSEDEIWLEDILTQKLGHEGSEIFKKTQNTLLQAAYFTNVWYQIFSKIDYHPVKQESISTVVRQAPHDIRNLKWKVFQKPDEEFLLEYRTVHDFLITTMSLMLREDIAAIRKFRNGVPDILYFYPESDYDSIKYLIINRKNKLTKNESRN